MVFVFSVATIGVPSSKTYADDDDAAAVADEDSNNISTRAGP